VTTALVDGFGRQVRDLRISITDRCNFRCGYCMPEEGMVWQPREELLTYEEIERVARVCVERWGFEAIRITGGEPTVRAHLPLLVSKLAALGVDVAMTTNGASMGLLAADLRAAGLSRVNISLDSLRRERFLAITRRDSLDRVLDGIASAVAAGFDPVKVNVVLMRGVNDDEIVDLAAFGRSAGVVVRFIEFMPLDAQGEWTAARVVPSAEVIDAVSSVFPLSPVDQRGSAPAEGWRYDDGVGEIGVISSVTQSFCGSCDRVRLTADGQFRNCLFAVDELDVRAPLRAGASDDELAALLEANVAHKWAGHDIGRVQFIRPSKSMSQIGG
jgi:cyclic pyranopterin phosphate synthase